MKIYIPNILPVSLKEKLNKLYTSYEYKKINKSEIISKESGLYIIENDKIYYIESSFNNDYELIQNFENIDLLVDKTIYTKIPLLSQLPVNYIHTKQIEIEFKFNQKSDLSLIIECLEEKKCKNNSLLINDYELIPFNFYFNYKLNNFDLQNTFLKEEFTSYLSNLMN
jgi:hypothetical protein